jgi:hypothetical protein
MKLQSSLFTCLTISCLFARSLLAQEIDDSIAESSIYQSRSQQIPRERLSQSDDTFVEGYLQALLDMHYYEFKLHVKVQDKKATLYNLPTNSVTGSSIVRFVEDFPGIEVVQTYNERELAIAKEQGEIKPEDGVIALTEPIDDPDSVKSIWFPQSTMLFPYPVADPHRVAYSLSVRREEKGTFNDTGTVVASFGDTFPIKRWLNVGPFYGDLQLSIDGAAWGYFEQNSEQELINTDYYVGIPISYAFDDWSFRLRYYHMSSHLGDEYMVSNPTVTRLNPSMEALDFLASRYINSSWRVYGGLGYIIRSDSSFPLDKMYLEGGVECRPPEATKVINHIHFQPYWALHSRSSQYDGWNMDYTANIGYEMSKLQNIGRKVRLFLELHDGRSYQGQFAKERQKHVSFNLSYGF